MKATSGTLSGRKVILMVFPFKNICIHFVLDTAGALFGTSRTPAFHIYMVLKGNRDGVCFWALCHEEVPTWMFFLFFFSSSKITTYHTKKTRTSWKMYLSLCVNDQIKVEGNEIKLSSYLFPPPIRMTIVT